MSWIEKQQRTNFEDLPIEGLHFLDGDTFAQMLKLKYGKVDVPFFNPDWLKNQKFPQVEFPSGESFDIWETSHTEGGGIIHIYGEMDLPYYDTRDRAWEQADDIAQQVGYLAFKRGENQLEVIGHDDEEHFLLTYDPDERRILDIAPILPKPAEQAHRPLLDTESRAKLPKLYTNEQLGLDESLAQVKFFDPRSNWTWYASEASAILRDGTQKTLAEIDPHDPQVEQVIFFGLVNGFELEFGYFTLEELEAIGDDQSIGIERDLHFKPTSLKALQDHHLNERSASPKYSPDA